MCASVHRSMCFSAAGLAALSAVLLHVGEATAVSGQVSPKVAKLAQAVEGRGHCGDPFATDEQDSQCEAPGTHLMQKTVKVIERQLPKERAQWAGATALSQADPAPKQDGDQEDPARSINRVPKQDGEADHNAKVKARGHYLGFSHDFWIVFGIHVAVVISIIVLVFVTVTTAVNWRCKWLPNEIPFESDGSITRPEFPVGFMQRVFRKDLNENFAMTADLSFRVALMIAVCGLSYWVKELSFLNNYGWTMAYVAEIVAFTAYSDLGSSVNFAWYNYYGTLLPVLNCLLIFGIADKGTGPGENFSGMWWFGLINFVVFSYPFLALQVPSGVRMFALSWMAPWSMSFLDPSNQIHFSTGIDDIILEGAAVGPLVATLFGMVLGIICVCPSPWGYARVGLGNSQEKAIFISWAEGMNWSKMIQFYSGSRSTLEIDQLCGEADFLQDQLQKLEGHMGATWWECLDKGKPGRVKAHIARLQQMFVPMHMWLRGVLEALREEEFSEEHDKLMAKVAPHMTQLAEAANKLSYRATKMGISGFSMSSVTGAELAVAAMEERALKVSIEETEAAQRALAAEFTKARKEVYGQDTLTPDAIGEHFFASALSSYAHHATIYAEYILSDQREPGIGVFQASKTGLASCLCFNDWKFQLRSCIAFFGASAVGWVGMKRGIMSPHSTGAAGTTAFLMAAKGKAGSAVVRNLARFQGVSGGYIIGSLLFASAVKTSDCGSLATGTLGMLVTVPFVFFAFYLYMSSSVFGYVGILMIVFGSGPLFQSCEAELSDTAVFTNMMTQALAIIFVMAPDLAIGNESAGHLAVKAWTDLVETLELSMKELFGVGQVQGQRSSLFLKNERESGDGAISDKNRIDILAKFLEAEALGQEAPLEPRWYRMPFKVQGWQNSLKAADQIAVKICVMEDAVKMTETVTKGKARSQVLELAVGSPTMSKFVDNCMEDWAKVFKLAEVLLRHETAGPLDVGKKFKDLEAHSLMSLEKSIPAIIAEVCERLPRQEVKDSLAADNYCLLAVVLMMTTTSFDQVHNVLKSCFQTPEITLDDLMGE